jgi:hypothetical protein
MARRRAVVRRSSIEAVVRERRRLEAKERSLIANLNASLKSMGFQIAPANSGSGPGGLKRRQASARRRKPMSAEARKAVGRRMKAYWAKRRAKAKNPGRRASKGSR